jgi:phosphoribosylformylglycinamidine synthase PurS subunit
MQFVAEIDVMPLKELLDPQGKAVKQALGQLGLSGVGDVRVGKHLRLVLEAADEAAARQIVETACKQLLANPVMEHFSFSVKPA